MTYKENIKAILECFFQGFKEEIIDGACDRILEQQPKPGRYCPTCGARMGESKESENMSEQERWKKGL